MTAVEGSSTPPLSLVGTTLAGGRYLIEDEIAIGTMGEVYRARDTKWPRVLAIKRIARHLSADPEARRRFRIEAGRSIGLEDPNIAVLHDVLEESDDLFLVMELVQGQTLRSRLSRLDGKPLEVSECLSIAIQCTRALEAAHAKGVLHCDLKPENIMVMPNGNVKVLDFGLARVLPRSTGPDEITHEMPSRAIATHGTPAYMSPEAMQAKEMDRTSDLYSLGVVLYELITGRNPFATPSLETTAQRVVHETPASARTVQPSVPQGLSRLLDRVLAKDPEDRVPTTTEVLEQLRRLRTEVEAGRALRRNRWAVAAAILLGAGLTIGLIPGLRTETAKFIGLVPRLPERKHVVVLPFRDLRTSSGQEPYLDGLTFVVTTKLASLEPFEKSFDVVSAREVLEQRTKSVKEARRRFGATLVVAGSVQRSNIGVRVTAELVEPRDGRILRAMPPIDLQTTETALLQDRVAVAVASLLELEIQKDAERFLRVGRTTDPRANEAYLAARGRLADPTQLQLAVAGFEEATALDPSFALAWAGLGEAKWRVYEAMRQPTLIEEARAAGERAVTIDPELPAAHASLGFVHAGTGNHELAIREFERALKLDPSNSDAYRGLASAYAALGRLKDAEGYFRRAIELHPTYWAGYSWLGVFLSRQGRYQEAISIFQRLVEVAPTNPRGHLNLGYVYGLVGREEEAIACFKKSLALAPDYLGYNNLAGMYFNRHEFSEAAANYQRALALNDGDYFIWGNLGECALHTPERAGESDSLFHKAIELGVDRLAVNPRDPQVLSRLAYYHSILGHSQEADRLILQALQVADQDKEIEFIAALVFERLGNRDRAFELLRSAIRKGYSVEEVLHAPGLDKLREDPRFGQLVQISS